jgi:hypothetical protein
MQPGQPGYGPPQPPPPGHPGYGHPGYGHPGYGPYGPPGYPPGYGGPPPKKSNTWVLVAILVGVVAVFGVVAGSKDGKKSKASATRTEPAADDRSERGASKEDREPPPALEVEVKALLAAYKENEVDADDRYKGKVVVVSGKVDDIGKDILDDAYVTVGTGAAFELPTAQCSLGDPTDAKGLKKGQAITVRGEVRGLMMNVQLGDCVVVAR